MKGVTDEELVGTVCWDEELVGTVCWKGVTDEELVGTVFSRMLENRNTFLIPYPQSGNNVAVWGAGEIAQSRG